MKQRALQLALKKQRLLLDCASQRIQLAEHAAGLEPLFAGADRVSAGAQWLREHAALATASAAAILMLRPRLMWRWGLRSLSMWRVARAFLNQF